MSSHFSGAHNSEGFSLLWTYCSKATQLAGPLLEEILTCTKIFIRTDNITIKSEEFFEQQPAACLLVSYMCHCRTQLGSS